MFLGLLYEARRNNKQDSHRHHIMSKRPEYCNWCDKHHSEVERLIDGPGVAICNECVRLMYDSLSLPPDQRFISLAEFRAKHGLGRTR